MEDDSDTTIVADYEVVTTPEEGVAQLQETLDQHRIAGLHRVVDPELKSVLDAVKAIAFSNMADFYEMRTLFQVIGINEDGTPDFQAIPRLVLKDITTLPRELTATIKKLKIIDEPSGGQRVELELYPADAAQDRLMKHLGAYAEDNRQRGDASESLLARMFERIGAQGLPQPTDNNS